MLVYAFVTNWVDYCNSILYRVIAVHVQPLQNVLNAVATIMLCKWKFDCINADLRDQLHWLPVQ